MKKKLLALMLVMAMVLGMSTTAMADEPVDNNTGKLVKEYVANKGTAPAADFEFTFTGTSAVDVEGEDIAEAVYPIIDTDNKVIIHFDNAGTKTATFDITTSNVKVGTYTYEVTETPSTVAGISAAEDNEAVYFVVTVYNDGTTNGGMFHYGTASGEKSGSIVNEYNSGELTVTKKIEGNLSDSTKEFDFTITLTAPDNKTVSSEITYKVAGVNGTIPVTFTAGSATITGALSNDESIEIFNIPADVTYSVTEDADGYKSDINYADNTKTILANDEDTVIVTNTLEDEVDTGIFTNNLPYIVALLAVALAAVAFMRRRREF